MSAGPNPVLATEKQKSVAVKTLVEFAAKTGSLDRRFTPAPTGQEGIEGHKKVTSRRGEGYQTEMSLSISYNGITFRGRADGYDPAAHCIDEIKTFYGDVDRIPENHRALHWAQARCYGWMYCALNGCDQVNLALIYFELATETEFLLEENWKASELQKYFELLAEKYCTWQTQLNQRRHQLQQWLEQLQFPYGEMHASQRVMAEAVYKAAATGRVVLAEAPTGTGKTLAALFPALKSIPRTPVDKIFYLTAKTTGKQLALENIQLITSAAAAPLRTLELTAQEKACLEPDKKCRGDSCPYALDFYSKLEAARQAAFATPMLNKQALNKLADQFEICPFYLSLEMSRWVDIVVADVNYYFDGTPLLLGLTNQFEWNPYLLVDESHNLIERGRSMYSAELNRAELLAAKKVAPAALKKPLEKINKAWLSLLKKLTQVTDDFVRIEILPEKLGQALVEFTNSYSEFLQQNPEHSIQESIAQEFFFAALNYQRIGDILDEDFCIDMQAIGSKAEIITLRNLIPAQQLAVRLSFAHSACFFSATLHPSHYYQTLLGLPEDTVHIKVPSPFGAHQLKVKIAHHLSTRYKDRQAAIAPVCEIIQQQLHEEPGNALVFFSSYEFLQQAEQQLRKRLAQQDIQLIVQSRRMSEQERENFIEQFNQHNNLLGLAVLGGAFSEGVDLSGDALKGAFIATLGLPQVNPINEYLRGVLQEQFGQGYDFTYTYPGIQKVIQAAGRVIRNQTDSGYLWLLDQRFGQSQIKALLPDWWNE
ncbi:ATP-dependent DNA helicase [Cellvibrio sp. KY-GH-1]|uniref:ATP-dependent DNA helicase n=1 Tax=Cellvibrio sp. KY-GH-1 TaxID=2303332 RepID=UPI0012491778|nr:ATP-dependent DNA helicase [Cellvibrio sp. KY-GH-1]QEY18605.1 ATP-dependent DNA helicase [Cellvibrio sp. KY-GH-1]